MEKLERFRKTVLASFNIVGTFLLLCAIAIMILFDDNGDFYKEPHWASILNLMPEIGGSLLIGLILNITLNRIIENYEETKSDIKKKEDEALLAQQKEDEEKRALKQSTENKAFIDDLANKTREEIHHLLNGFREIRVVEVFQKAKEFVQDSSTIRVIGTAKQDYSDSEANHRISEYLKITVERVKRIRPKLRYRRITTLNMTHNFTSHVEDILENNPYNNEKNDFENDCKILIIDDFIPAYTYLIIDDKFLMLSLNYSEQPHNTYHYYTENKRIIEQFTYHFITVWNRERRLNKSINSVEDFRYYLNYRKEIQESLNQIKHTIKSFPNNNTYFQKHALKELQQVANIFLGIERKEVEVKHNVANGNLLSLFCTYLSNLKQGDTYETVTFYDFWKDIINNDHQESGFLSNNEKALGRQVKMTRILVVDSKRIDNNSKNSSYRNGIGHIIDINFRLLKEYPSNYDFRIYFTSRHNILRREFYNFAIINSIKENINQNTISVKERILFEPVNTQNINSTRIWFQIIKKPIKGATSNMIQIDEKVHEKFEEKERKLSQINKDWKTQNINPEYVQFLREYAPEYFTKDNNDFFKSILGNKILL